MITVSWESPVDDGGSAITGYVLQRKTGTMDFMTIAASSAEMLYMEHLMADYQPDMMNAVLGRPLRRRRRYRHDIALHGAMYAELHDEATTMDERL